MLKCLNVCQLNASFIWTMRFLHPTSVPGYFCVADYTLSCPPTFLTLIHTHTYTAECCLAFLNANVTVFGRWPGSVAIVTVGLDGSLEGFSLELEPCECLGLLCLPSDEKICVNASLSNLKSLNKHFKHILEYLQTYIMRFILVITHGIKS